MAGFLSLRQLRQELTGLLAAAGLKEPVAEARQIMSAVLDLPLARLLAEPDLLIEPAQASQARLWARRRAQHEPLAYILGRTYFAGLAFVVGPGCLIPRSDSELLVETALHQLACRQERLDLLDTFTGSGCLGISLAVRLRQQGRSFWLELADNDSQALAWAEKNIAAHGLGQACRLSQADIFPPDAGPYDLIMANPPYIASGQLAGLETEVRDHEPANALDGQADGLYYYRELARRAPEHLKEQGWLLLEHGYDQAGPVREILSRQGFSCQPTQYDFAGNPRALAAGRPAI